ncbi:hypothetical protein DRN46_01655 [Thermococci archaeon]|nr:MAG: hypothetical protein DRN46_01655 [Thermococci archaeon]
MSMSLIQIIFLIIAQRIGIGLSSDAPFLADRKSEVNGKIVVADSASTAVATKALQSLNLIKRGGKFKSKNAGCSILDSSSLNF